MGGGGARGARRAAASPNSPPLSLLFHLPPFTHTRTAGVWASLAPGRRLDRMTGFQSWPCMFAMVECCRRKEKKRNCCAASVSVCVCWGDRWNGEGRVSVGGVQRGACMPAPACTCAKGAGCGRAARPKAGGARGWAATASIFLSGRVSPKARASPVHAHGRPRPRTGEGRDPCVRLVAPCCGGGGMRTQSWRNERVPVCVSFCGSESNNAESARARAQPTFSLAARPHSSTKP